MAKPNYHHGDLREALLHQAELEVEENGVEQLSLRKIAKRAGVSHTAPAHHFGDARGLYTALTALGFERLRARLSATESLGPVSDRRIAVSVAYVEFALSHPSLFALMFASDRPDFSDKALDAASMETFQYFLQHASPESSGSKATSSGINVAGMAAWSSAHGLATLLIKGRMRSVLRLGPEARNRAIWDILNA